MITDFSCDKSPLSGIFNNNDDDIDIEKLLLNKIDYTREEIGTGDNSIISRNVNGLQPEIKQNMYTHISENCVEETVYVESLADKYNRLIKKKQSCESSQGIDENIDNLIANTRSEILNLEIGMIKFRSVWRSLYASIPADQLGRIDVNDALDIKNIQQMLDNVADYDGYKKINLTDKLF
ncbi:MAG: hypothetical protein MUP82_06210 [Candidatus Marinimicrobia bacterium]|nr:hypothetical protein [Candidatus Neomarinimicrobiota bacterium]